MAKKEWTSSRYNQNITPYLKLNHGEPRPLLTPLSRGIHCRSPQRFQIKISVRLPGPASRLWPAAFTAFTARGTHRGRASLGESEIPSSLGDLNTHTHTCSPFTVFLVKIRVLHRVSHCGQNPHEKKHGYIDENSNKDPIKNGCCAIDRSRCCTISA